MGIRRSLSRAAALIVFCAFAMAVAPVAEALAQQPGMQGQRPQGQGMPQGQQGGAPQGQQQGGGANACMQSHQRCVMMCAGVGNCVNNCNIGYSVCMQQQGGRK